MLATMELTNQELSSLVWSDLMRARKAAPNFVCPLDTQPSHEVAWILWLSLQCILSQRSALAVPQNSNPGPDPQQSLPRLAVRCFHLAWKSFWQNLVVRVERIERPPDHKQNGWWLPAKCYSDGYEAPLAVEMRRPKSASQPSLTGSSRN